jgi:hypothetical protein
MKIKKNFGFIAIVRIATLVAVNVFFSSSMKKKILGIVVLGIVVVGAININLNNSIDKYSAISLANLEALSQESNNEFIYRIDKEECDFQVSSTGHVNVIFRLFGLNANIGASADLSDATALYALNGEYRLGTDVRCADVISKLLAAL